MLYLIEAEIHTATLYSEKQTKELIEELHHLQRTVQHLSQHQNHWDY